VQLVIEATLTHEDAESKQLDPCNVFVKHLPSELRDADLAALFGPFGHVLSSKIMIDPALKKSLGFGYVLRSFQALKLDHCPRRIGSREPPSASLIIAGNAYFPAIMWELYAILAMRDLE